MSEKNRDTDKKNHIINIIIIIAWLALIAIAMTACAYRSNNLEMPETFCLWARPITLERNELNALSKETLKEIDYYNTSYEKMCFY